VDPASAAEARLLLRCLGALLRRHALLLPDLALDLLALLMQGCGPDRCARVCG
jgi:hypothetical protein